VIAASTEELITDSEPHHLRVLIANERAERLERVAVVVVSLGHTVIARELDVDEVGQVTREERPDVALVGLGESSEHALEHISQIVREAACPVIALLGTDDPVFVSEAARRGVFGSITIADGDGSRLQGAIDIALSRFAEYHNLEGAFGRRAVIERAKGILMERHGAGDDAAFEMLREHSQHTGRKLFDIAQAVLDSHLLLSPVRAEGPTGA
jgi:AmiR/NasT family two-component response regulator